MQNSSSGETEDNLGCTAKACCKNRSKSTKELRNISNQKNKNVIQIKL